MTALQRVIAEIGTHAWAGLAAAGWMVALLVALVAIWQAARAERVGVRAAEAAHELRGPLCAARLALAALERALPDAPRLMRATAAIDLELRRAGLALDALTEVASTGVRRARSASRPQRELVDLSELAGAAEPTWRAVAEARGTSLEVRTLGAPVMVLADPRQLLQGIGNLVANACEHGRGPVRVTVDRNNWKARVSISDRGDGPSAQVVRRARRRARAGWAPGTRASLRGHGMAIVARIARESGGRLHADADGQGAVVSIELPSETQAAPSRRGPSEQLIRSVSRVLCGAPYDGDEARRSAPLAGAR